MDLDIIYRLEHLPGADDANNATLAAREHLGLWFVRHYPIYVVLMCLSAVLGTFGNILVISSVLTVKKLRSATNNKFIINLAFADVTVTGMVIPMNIVGVFYGEEFFAGLPGLCSTIGFFCLTSCFCSLLNIGAIAFNRYICICRNASYVRIFSNRNTKIACFSLWIFSAIAVSPNFFGWGAFSFDDKQFVCAYDRLADFSYTLFFAVVGIYIPLLVIGVSYARIYLFVRRSRQRLSSSSASQSTSSSGLFNSTSTTGHRRLRRELVMLRTFFVVFVTYAFCWIPYATIVVTDVSNSFPVQVHAFAVLLCHSNSSFNCIIYGLFNRQFRDAYLSIICRVRCSVVRPRQAGRVMANNRHGGAASSANDDNTGLLEMRRVDGQVGTNSDSRDS